MATQQTNTKLKRSFPNKRNFGKQKNLKKTRIDSASFTSPEFKVLIKNSASIFLAFERFNSYVEEFLTKTIREQNNSYDIIAEYLHGSPECKEIFDILANKDVYFKSEMIHVLVTLDYILLALRKEDIKGKFPTSADTICKALSNGHFQRIYNLVLSGKGKVNEAAVKLLTTVAKHGSLATRLLFSGITFVKEDVQALYTEKAVAKLRQPFILLLLALLENASPPVLKAIIDEKGLLNGMFSQLYSDGCELIERVLTTLDTHILSNPGVNKTQRVRLFNVTTVPQILQCYQWKKPVKREKEKGTSSEETKVKQLVCQFAKALLYDQKKCITFSDPEFGQGERNMNHVVTLILSKSVLRNAYADTQLEEVVIACLTSRPDQLHRYMAILEESTILVKNTESWLIAANHVIKLMYTLPPFSHYVTPVKSMSDEVLCNIALAVTCPKLSTTKIFKHVLSMPDLSWQYSALGFIVVVMNRAKEAIATVGKVYDTERFDTWRALYTDKFMQLVPHVDVILHCWTSVKKTLKSEEFNCVRPKFAGRVLDILILYLHISPVSVYQSTMPINVSAILQDIENMAAVTHSDQEDSSAEFAGLTVKALQLLSDLGDEAGLAAMKMKRENRSTLLMILKLIYGNIDPKIGEEAKQLLIKQLRQSGWFEKLDTEIETWFDNGDKLESVEFLEQVLITLFSNPYPYLDMVCEAVTAVSQHPKLDRVVDTKALPFSPLVTIALKLYNKFNESGQVQEYMFSCMSAILLRQGNPLPLAFLLSKETKIGLSNVAKVLLGSKKITSKDCCLPPYDRMWNLFFQQNWKSPEAAASRLAILQEVRLLSNSRSQEVACSYCLLALWHCQELDNEEEIVSYIGDIMDSLEDRMIAARLLLQSEVACKWYLCEDAPRDTLYYVTNLCNGLLDKLDSNQILELQQPNKVYRDRIIPMIDNIGGIKETKMVTLILQSLKTLSPTFSSADLVNVTKNLIGASCNHTEDYWLCLNSCVQNLFSVKAPGYSEILQRLAIVDSIAALSEVHKFKILYTAVTTSCCAEVVPFNVWEECVTIADSSNSQLAPVSDLLVWLIGECVSESPTLRLIALCKETQLRNQLPIVNALLSKVFTKQTAESFLPLWKPLYTELKHNLRGEDTLLSDLVVDVLGQLVPHTKHKHARKLATTLFGCDRLLTSAPLLSLALAVPPHCPDLYTQLFTLILSQVSVLTNQTVDVIGKELSSLSLPKEVQVEIQQFATNKWKDFVFQALRRNYDSGAWLRLVTAISRQVYSSADSTDPTAVDLTPGDLFQLLISHSKFLPVIMSNGTSAPSGEAKGELLALLTLLVELSPTACSSDQYPIWLSAYQATLSSDDRKLLHLMNLYEESGVSTIKYRPYLWGAAGASHYAVKQNVVQTLSSQPSVDAVIECIDQELLHRSAYSLPLHRKFCHQQASPGSSDTSEWLDDGLYDPAFLLPLFAYIMRPDNTLNTRLLIDNGIITYILCCLTSHVEDVRAASRFILHEFRQHLESSVYSETLQGLYVLDLLKESLPTENCRVPPVIAVFISRTLQLSPEEHMYRVCHNYLLIKPKMELELVPEFFRLFYSSSQGFAVERSWVLSLLLTGLREDSDFRLYEKLNIFRCIMAYAQCKLCSPQDRGVILGVISSACSLPTSYQIVIKYNIVGWLSGIIFSFPSDALNALNCIRVLVKKPLTDKPWFETFCSQLITTLISLIRRIRFGKEEGQMFVEILYHAIVLRRKARLSTSKTTKTPQDNGSLAPCEAPLALFEAETIVQYLPNVSSKYEDIILRMTHSSATIDRSNA